MISMILISLSLPLIRIKLTSIGVETIKTITSKYATDIYIPLSLGSLRWKDEILMAHSQGILVVEIYTQYFQVDAKHKHEQFKIY